MKIKVTGRATDQDVLERLLRGLSGGEVPMIMTDGNDAAGHDARTIAARREWPTATGDYGGHFKPDITVHVNSDGSYAVRHLEANQ